MRAVVLTGRGGPEMLRYRTDVARPAPAAGEVLVRVRAAAVNNTDIAFRTNWYDDDPGESPIFPRIQGAGGAGVVEAVGERVDGLAPGEAVVVDPFLRRADTSAGAALDALLGAAERDGCFAEYVVVPAENVIPAAAPLTFAELACLPTAHQTAEEMQLRAELAPGQTVLVTGASGGVGSANVELAKLRGATVIAVADPAKHTELRALGADHVIARPAPDTTAIDWSDLPAVDAVLDVAGGALTQFWLTRLRVDGVFVTAGAIAGWAAQIDLRTVIYNDLTLIGQVVARRDAMMNLIGYARDGRLRPRVAAVYPLSRMTHAQAAFVAKGFVGKIVIDIDGAQRRADD